MRSLTLSSLLVVFFLCSTCHGLSLYMLFSCWKQEESTVCFICCSIPSACSARCMEESVSLDMLIALYVAQNSVCVP